MGAAAFNHVIAGKEPIETKLPEPKVLVANSNSPLGIGTQMEQMNQVGKVTA